MLEYFTYKKIKKHQAEKRAAEGSQPPLLSQDDESFLERIVAEGTPPALPERPTYLNQPEVGDANGNTSQMVVHDNTTTASEKADDSKGKGKGKAVEAGKEKKKTNRFSFLSRAGTKKGKDGLEPKKDVAEPEAEREEDDLSKVLDDLNLAAVNNRVFSLSKESQLLVQRFTVVLKDIVNGVPTAYDDLVRLLEDSQSTLAKNYENLPSYLKKLITTLPNKLTSTLAPELLAVAAEAQAFTGAGASAAGAGGFAGAAKGFMNPTFLKNIVTKPGAIAGMLRTILNALKLRWPAFMGTSVLLSLALFMLLFVLWYCHKRGREVRLEKESKVDSEGRIVELEDDAMLDAPGGTGEASVNASSPAPIGAGNGKEKASEKVVTPKAG